MGTKHRVREREIIKNTTDIWELKNTMNKIKNAKEFQEQTRSHSKMSMSPQRQIIIIHVKKNK